MPEDDIGAEIREVCAGIGTFLADKCGEGLKFGLMMWDEEGHRAWVCNQKDRAKAIAILKDTLRQLESH